MQGTPVGPTFRSGNSSAVGPADATAPRYRLAAVVAPALPGTSRATRPPSKVT